RSSDLPQCRLGAAGHALRSGRARRRPVAGLGRPFRTSPADRGVEGDSPVPRARRARRLSDLLDPLAPVQGAVLGVAGRARAPGRRRSGPAPAAPARPPLSAAPAPTRRGARRRARGGGRPTGTRSPAVGPRSRRTSATAGQRSTCPDPPSTPDDVPCAPVCPPPDCIPADRIAGRFPRSDRPPPPRTDSADGRHVPSPPLTPTSTGRCRSAPLPRPAPARGPVWSRHVSRSSSYQLRYPIRVVRAALELGAGEPERWGWNRVVGEQLTSLRRQPVQQRSALRVARMLDAAAELLDEVGYERLTTTAIAKRAGVAVGSLYQFFPDKRAVVQALTQRNLERFMSLAAERLAAVDHQHWWDVVDGLLDIYLEMHHETPGFSRIHFGDAVDPRL